MRIRIFTLIFLIVIPMFIFPSFSLAIDYDYAWANPLYLGEESCLVILWIYENGAQRKVEYYGKLYDDNNCHVEVPNAIFEKDFKYCVLSGIKVAETMKTYLAEFGGGPAGGREKYWFEWSKDVSPDFYCILNKNK